MEKFKFKLLPFLAFTLNHLVYFYPKLLFRKMSVTRWFLVSLTSIVGKKIYYSMEVNETRNCLVTDILLNIRKSAEWIRKWYNPTV